MERKHTMPFEQLKVYQDARDFSRIARRISEALPPEHEDIRQMLHRADLTIIMKIARGTAEFRRNEAYRTFRISQRAAELCHSILERLRLAELAPEADCRDGLALLERIDTALQRITDRIKSNLSMRDVFAE